MQFNTFYRWSRIVVAWLFMGAVSAPVLASQQMYEPMAESVRLAMQAGLGGSKTPYPLFESARHRIDWLSDMSRRLAKKIPNFGERVELMKTIRYEAQRAGLDPQLIFAVIEVESGFKPEARSPVGALGLMQVMPFWAGVLADGNSDALLEPRINIRYGCLILRHYLDIERGDVDRALARYNGSLGKTTYSDLVNDRLYRHWRYKAPPPPPTFQSAQASVQ